MEFFKVWGCFSAPEIKPVDPTTGVPELKWGRVRKHWIPIHSVLHVTHHPALGAYAIYLRTPEEAIWVPDRDDEGGAVWLKVIEDSVLIASVDSEALEGG